MITILIKTAENPRCGYDCRGVWGKRGVISNCMQLYCLENRGSHGAVEAPCWIHPCSIAVDTKRSSFASCQEPGNEYDLYPIIRSRTCVKTNCWPLAIIHAKVPNGQPFPQVVGCLGQSIVHIVVKLMNYSALVTCTVQKDKGVK